MINVMESKLKKITALLLFAVFLPSLALAQESSGEIGTTPGEAFYKGQVLEVISEDFQETGENRVLNQTLKVKIISGEEKGQELSIDNQGIFTANGGKGFKAGDKVVIYKVNVVGQGEVYYIADNYRLPGLIWILVIFFVAAIAFSRWKGVTSILGLGITILVIAKFVVPQIAAGQNPLLISLAGAVIIALTSIYLSHGFNKRTSVALVGMLITLAISAGMAIIFVSATKLLGLGSEQAFYLQFGPLETLNLQGLLLGGIILGALGVLDDVTTTQSATVEELKRANANLSFRELYHAGSSVGREHITSLVNTLFLAYAGASLPLFLFFSSQNPQPIWVTLNTEFIAEEVVRTLVGSITLILAVPITTFLAAYYFSKKSVSSSESKHSHIH